MKKRASPGLAGPGGSVQPGSGGTTGGSVEYQTGYDGLAVPSRHSRHADITA
ncbi:hypothetical protein ACFC0X_13825 [Paenibacillus chitinolyticus]|uniref:hypothetical protein n=1 Tax=Paenibacillus chitinolyticus TaxID=79263 RepID=UPI0035D84BF7